MLLSLSFLAVSQKGLRFCSLQFLPHHKQFVPLSFTFLTTGETVICTDRWRSAGHCALPPTYALHILQGQPPTPREEERLAPLLPLDLCIAEAINQLHLHYSCCKDSPLTPREEQQSCLLTTVRFVLLLKRLTSVLHHRCCKSSRLLPEKRNGLHPCRHWIWAAWMHCSRSWMPRSQPPMHLCPNPTGPGRTSLPATQVMRSCIPKY